MKCLLFAVILLITACSSNRYFVVRHAEKLVLAKDSTNIKMNNPPLSEAGKVRAFVLRDELAKKHIKHIYATHTLRATATAEPLSQQKNIAIETYSNIDSLIILLQSRKGNSLIIGHSNTVDDIINKMSGKIEIPGDLKETEFDNFYMLKEKKGHLQFTKKKYGYPSSPE